MKNQVSSIAAANGLKGMVMNNKVMIAVATFFSRLEGEEVTPVQALSLLSLMASFTLLMVAGGSHFLVAIVLLVWMAASVLSLAND